MYAAFAHRDEAALLAHVDPAMRVHDRPHHPDASVYEGQDGFLSFAQTDWDAFDEVSYEPQDFIARSPTSSSRSRSAAEARAVRSASMKASSTSGSCATGSASSYGIIRRSTRPSAR